MNKRRVVFYVLALLLLSWLCYRPVPILSVEGGWTSPIPISSDVTGPSQFPKIVADSIGQLHVVWAENSYRIRDEADAVFYSYYNGASWSPPVDVLVSPDLQTVKLGELVMLPDETLALLWIGANTLQFSRAGTSSALQPSEWQTEALFGGAAATDAFMVFAPPATLYIAYVDLSTNGVMFADSDDLGITWRGPTSVWLPASEAFAAEDVRLCMDSTGQILHLVWHENARENNWNSNGIWYLRSLDQGSTWGNETFLPNRGSSPNCAYDGTGTLHMLWNNAVGSVDGRYHRSSNDNGAIWTEPTVIFPGLSGRTRAPAMAVDSDGTLYVLNGAYAAGKTQMFASYWQGNGWAQPLSISEDLVSNESPDMVVTGGNRLNAVWHFGYEDTSFIWFSTYTTDAPPLVLAPLTGTVEPPRATSEPLIPEAHQVQPTPVNTMPELPFSAAPDMSPKVLAQTSTLLPLIWAIVTGLLLTGSAVGITLSRQRR